MEYIYEKIIEALNNGEIKQIRFMVNNYFHYRDCVIERMIDSPCEGKHFIRIAVKLTPDGSEMVSFLNTFNENYKLFHLGRKGSFTLKQLWPKITILEIVKA